MPAPTSGQATGTGLSNAIALSATPVPCTAFVLKAPLSNKGPVFIGPAGVTSTTGHQLDQGDEYTYERLSQSGQPRYELSVSDFYMAGQSGDLVTWLASP